MTPAPLSIESRARLLQRWKHVLRFSIGADDSAHIGQLPNGKIFPAQYPTDDPGAAWALREVLGVACLKLYRWSCPEDDVHLSLDPAGGWLLDIKSLKYAMGDAHLAPLGRALEMALCTPERLPALIARLDALDNADLHEMALAAVQGLPVPDLFEGLME